jgi:tellurite methyltransferase
MRVVRRGENAIDQNLTGVSRDSNPNENSLRRLALANSDRQRWNEKYLRKAIPSPQPPDNWLCHAVTALIPGRALDLACGLGHNAIWLERQGWRVDAVDISDVGLSLAAQSATASGSSSVTWIAADLDIYAPDPGTYDLITVFRFLDRGRLPSLIEAALRPSGTLVYETFTQQHLTRSDNHLKSDRFTLLSNELPRLFPKLIIEQFEEVDLQDRSVARLIARKPTI